jgi:hypothetical protein
MESVTAGSDGVPEVNLYPHDMTPGNFGLLNLPSSSGADAATHKEQIENGVQPEDIEPDFGSTEVTFYDESGDPMTHILAGNPGLESSLQSALQARVGDVIAFLLHDQVVDVGNNTEYRVVGIRFGRLMDVKLTGNPHQTGLWIQPTIYAGDGIHVDKNAPSSGGTMGRLVLGR